MRMKGISENPQDKAIIDGVVSFLQIAKRSKNAEMIISVSMDCVPVISYKIEELPIIVNGGDNHD